MTEWQFCKLLVIPLPVTITPLLRIYTTDPDEYDWTELPPLIYSICPPIMFHLVDQIG
jgi:hypothetical protein